MQLQAKYVILGLLYNQAMSGYEMKKRFEEHFSFFFDASYGSVYPSLTKLEQEGSITKQTVIQEGRPTKFEYEITPQGREQFNEYLHSPLAPNSLRSDLCMRLYFGEHTDGATVVAWLEKSMRTNQEHVETLEKLRAFIGPKMSASQLICISIGIEHYRAWNSSILKGLEQLRGAKIE